MHDALIIGAGPAGLTAATYLGRFHRKAVVIDGGASRASWIPESHNIPGFAHGVGGAELLGQLRTQATRYGADIRRGQVDAITRCADGFQVQIEAETLLCRYVLLATGVRDLLPELAGAKEAVLRSLLRICPICDAYEATGKHIAVIGSSQHAEREAQFLQTYSERITLIHICGPRDPEADVRMRKAGIEVVTSRLTDLYIENNGLTLRTGDGESLSFDVVYSAMGCAPQNQLAADLGADLDENRALRVNAHQQTSIPGLYAAGDIVRGLNQVVVAAAEAAIAATDIHNQLRARDHG